LSLFLALFWGAWTVHAPVKNYKNEIY